MNLTNNKLKRIINEKIFAYLLAVSKSIWIIFFEKPCLISSLPGKYENLANHEKIKTEAFYKVI